MIRKKWFFPALLTGLFIILVLLTVPKGCVYGSYTDWLSQHVRLAETIRSACIEQKTLTPAFLPLGGGSNGYQFSYYGYLRPDIIIGCLFPSVPMVYFIIGYMLTGYLASVLLCYYWLGLHLSGHRSFNKNIWCTEYPGTNAGLLKMRGFIANDLFASRTIAFFGSVLFLTAACFFHTHRQIMFINYMPFLILALIAVRKKWFRFLPLILLLIYVNSFYYSIACLASIGWYWLRQEGKSFWKNGFLHYLKCTFLSIGMAALLLMPTALVILEHRRASDSLSLAEICGVSVNLQSLLYSPYGMGLTAVCLYALLLGLTNKKYRLDSIFLIIVSTWCMAAWILNGTLYARAKILIPFVPLVVLQCVKVFYTLFNEGRPLPFLSMPKQFDEKEKHNRLHWKLWPCIVLAASLPFWTFDKNFVWIAADVLLLTCMVLIYRLSDIYYFVKPPLKNSLMQKTACWRNFIKRKEKKAIHNFYQLRNLLSCILLCLMPCMLFFQTMQKEAFVEKEDVSKQESTLDAGILEESGPLYRYDSIADALNTGNLATGGDLQKSAMYSSVFNKRYSEVYYETFQSPVQINNRLAILPSANPFLLNFLGIRFLKTTSDYIPDGYHAVSPAQKNSGMSKSDSAASVIVENTKVLPTAYVTDSYISEAQFEELDNYEKLDAITRYTIIPTPEDSIVNTPSSSEPQAQAGIGADSEIHDFNEVKSFLPTFKEIACPDTIRIEKTGNGYLLDVKQKANLTLELETPLEGQILLLDFNVVNYGKKAVVIDIDHMRNKLSGSAAPYPNGNSTFHYQLSGSPERGLNRLKITLSKGKYLLNNMNWHTYDQKLLSQKLYSSVKNQDTRSSEILSCTASAQDGSYFITSIPMQKGMEILVDEKTVPILKVNQAFAGAKLEKGTHNIRVVFSAPGLRTGYLLSMISFFIYLIPFVLWCWKVIYAAMLRDTNPAVIHLK